MQRWIVIAAVGAILVGLAGGFALWTYRQNREDKVWVPLALNSEVPAEKREAIAKELKVKLLEDSHIANVVKDENITTKLKLGSDAEAEAELKKRLFVEVGEARVPDGSRVPSLNIGFHCQKKSFDAMGGAAKRLMKDVWKLVGIKEPDQQTF